MDARKTTIKVGGMTCASCEARVSKAIAAVPGITVASAELGAAAASFEYDADVLSRRDAEAAARAAVEAAGYSAAGVSGASSYVALGAGVLLVAAYLLASSLGVFSSLPAIDSSLGYGMLFVAGLLTSVHCVAMCGGIALSQSVPKEGQASRPLLPALLYNLGRLVSYTLIGGAVGALGAVFDFSPLVKGAIAALAGAFMVFLGLRMLGVLKGFSFRFRPLAPLRSAAARLGAGRKGPFAVGLLNGFMPCGPLQTMQLYALGAGSFAAGAFSMFIFSLGTIPLLFAFGALAASLPRRLLPSVARASAVLVIFLGAVTVARAAALSGFDLSLPGPSLAKSAPGIPGGPASAAGSAVLASGGPGSAAASGKPTAVVSGGVQTVTTDFIDGDYVPFVVQAGVPVRWTVRIKAEDITGCNNVLVVPSLKIKKALKPGDNVIEFTPAKAGAIPYSCWMGMIRSRITVVDSLPGASAPGKASTNP